MKTIKFATNIGGIMYGCSEKGYHSGEYVPAEVAQGLLEALELAAEDLKQFHNWMAEKLSLIDVDGAREWHDNEKKIRAAIARAKGEKERPTLGDLIREKLAQMEEKGE